MNSTRICILFAFFSLLCNTTASRPSLSDNILSCEPLLLDTMTDCLNYLEKGSRNDHPASSCCSVVRDVWKVDPECVNFNVLDGSILLYYVGFDRNTTRVDCIITTCGIMDGSLKSNPPARPPVALAASPLEIRPSVQPSQGSSASTPMALLRKSASLLEGKQSIQSIGQSLATPMALSPKSGDADSSSLHSSHSSFWYFYPAIFLGIWVTCYSAMTKRQQEQQ
ncbi:non-specific lipid-transfer protein-like protein [Tanacetum coccineum]